MQCPIVIYNRKIILGTLLFWRVHARTAPHGTWLKRESVGTAETGPKNHAIEETRRKGERHVYIVMDVAVVAAGGSAAVASPLAHHSRHNGPNPDRQHRRRPVSLMLSTLFQV